MCIKKTNPVFSPAIIRSRMHIFPMLQIPGAGYRMYGHHQAKVTLLGILNGTGKIFLRCAAVAPDAVFPAARHG